MPQVGTIIRGTGTSFPIIVDYSLPIEQLVEEGTYDWVYAPIAGDDFPSQQGGEGLVTVDLKCSIRKISTNSALCELDQMGYRSVDPYELLAFGRTYPDIQREFPVVGLNVLRRNQQGEYFVMELGTHGWRRCLHFVPIEQAWGRQYRFAVVRRRR